MSSRHFEAAYVADSSNIQITISCTFRSLPAPPGDGKQALFPVWSYLYAVASRNKCSCCTGGINVRAISSCLVQISVRFRQPGRCGCGDGHPCLAIRHFEPCAQASSQGRQFPHSGPRVSQQLVCARTEKETVSARMSRALYDPRLRAVLRQQVPSATQPACG
jgi:hypothetical protein